MWCATNAWLFMVFTAYAFLLSVRLHFTFSMMVMMAKPLVAGPGDREPCPDSTVRVGHNSTIEVNRRLDWTPKEQAAAMGAYYIGTLVSAFPVGVYSSMGHERSILLWCLVVTTVTVALVPTAAIRYDSWKVVTLLRFLQGCAFGPSGPCGGTLAAKILPKSKSTLYSTYMFSGTLFGGFTGNMFSGAAMPYVSHDGTYYTLMVFGLVWIVTWKAMVLAMPYVHAEDVNDLSPTTFLSTPWNQMLSSWPYIGLLFASLGYGYLYSFITTGLPIYGAKVLGLDIMENGIQVSIAWLLCWVTSILAGLSAIPLTYADTLTKTIVRKLYAAIVLIGSPLMLMGVVLADCNRSMARHFARMSVILLGFERSSLRINSLDLCPKYAGCLIALCDVFFSLGNIMDLVIARNLFEDLISWNVLFLLAITLPMTCSMLYISFGSSKKQCWDQRYTRDT